MKRFQHNLVVENAAVVEQPAVVEKPAAVGLAVEKASVKRLDVFFADHGMDPGDEFVGPDGGRYFLDYGGEAVILADSRRGQDRTAYEKALEGHLRGLIKT